MADKQGDATIGEENRIFRREESSIFFGVFSCVFFGIFLAERMEDEQKRRVRSTRGGVGG